MTASPDPYDATLSAIRGSVEDLAVALAIWSYREEPDAQARRAASDAVERGRRDAAGLAHRAAAIRQRDQDRRRRHRSQG